MKIYVAGKITNNPGYKEQFAAAEKGLTEEGNLVMNPAILPEGFGWQQYMDICIPMLEACEAIYLLKGWETSKGDNQEKAHAEKLGLAILYEAEPHTGPHSLNSYRFFQWVSIAKRITVEQYAKLKKDEYDDLVAEYGRVMQY